MQCPHNQRGASGDRNPERRIHCEEGEVCNSDPNQSVSFHLSQYAGGCALSLLDFGRTKKRASNSLTMPSTPAFRCRDHNSPRLSELERREFANLGLLWTFRCADSRTHLK